jgi:hypothetical protein
MIRKTVQAAICLCLSPLLAAQEANIPTLQEEPRAATPHPKGSRPAASIKIPRDTKISLIALENVSSETATAGSTVRFAVGEDVIIGGKPVLRAGTPVIGIVTKSIRGVAGQRNGLLRIRVNEIRIGKSVLLRLTRSDPEERARPGNIALATVGLPLLAVGWVVAQPINLVLIASDHSHREPAPKPAGDQAVLPMCFEADYWIAAAENARPSDLSEVSPDATVTAKIDCPLVSSEGNNFELK